MDTNQKVLISGAGPVGMYAALRLARAGIPVTVFEAEPVFCEEYRAAAWHAPTVDMFEDVGARDMLIERGTTGHIIRMSDRLTGNNLELKMELLGEEGIRNPYIVVCSQPNSIRVFADLLADYPNAEVLMEHRVTAARQAENKLTVEVETPDGTKEFSGDWLVGTDGARSIVRKTIGAEFDGFTWEDRYLIMETDYDQTDFLAEFGETNYIADAREWRFVMTLPNDDGSSRWRVVCAVPEGVTDEEAISDPYVQERFQATLRRSEPYRIDERRVYRVHQRTANRFRKGRMLLAGDSAHLNNPLGGQGANSGVHDAENLCEKLLQVIAGESGDDILDLYDRQRRLTNINKIQPETIENKTRMDEQDPLKRKQNAEMMAAMNQNPAMLRKFLCRWSMLDSLRYAAGVT